MSLNVPAIDMHSHAIPGFLREAFADAGKRPSLSSFPEWSPEAALRLMDAFDIERSILSISAPGVNFGDDDASRTLARQFNEFCAELRTTFPGRFGAFGVLPLPDIDGACDEVAHALDRLQLEGIGLLSSYGDKYLGHAMYEPLLAELDKRRARVFLHPVGHGSLPLLNLDYPMWMIEYPFATTRAALDLVMSGATQRYPNIRWLLAHNGGVLPYLHWRVNSVSLIDKRYSHLPPDFIASELAKFYYEIAQAPSDHSISSLLRTTDASHILFGTDWPYCQSDVTEAILDAFEGVSSLSLEEKRSVLRKNAEAFLS